MIPNIDAEYLLHTLREMIRIPSVLPDEKRLAEFIAEEIRSMGIEPKLHEAAPGRPNVYARTGLGASPGFLVFSGHTDTVPPASDWKTNPFEPVEEQGRLYGLGAINMKSGLACALAAFKALVESKDLHPRLGSLGFAATVDQEGLSIGAEALLNTEYGRCDAMLHAEHFHGDSREDYLPIACTGKVLYKLSIKGRAAHAFRPHEGGVNAVVDASRIVAALDRLKLREHPALGKGTVCALKMEGGYKQYSIVVPDRCEIIITRLIVPGETRDVAVQDMADLVDSLDLESKVEIETPPPAYDPYFLDETSPILTSFKEAYREVKAKDAVFAGHRGIVDANVFVAKGKIPTVVFGPKGAKHHLAGEYVETSTLVPTARVYADTALKYFSGEPSEK